MSLGIILHHFVGGVHPYIQGAMTVRQFEMFIEAIGPENIMDPRSWIDAREAGKLPNKSLCLTFDDALRSQFDLALPVLEAYGLKAFFFVYSSIFEGKIEEFEVYRYFKNLFYDDMNDFYADFYSAAKRVTGLSTFDNIIGSQAAKDWLSNYPFYTVEDRQFRYVRDCVLDKSGYDHVMLEVMRMKDASVSGLSRGIWMNGDHVRYLVDTGHSIGLHSHSHPTNMRGLARQEQEREYDQNISRLTDLIGTKPDIMAHPSGSYSDETLNILRARGIRIGFRSDDQVGSGSLLELPRLDYKLTPQWRKVEQNSVS